MSYSGQTTTVGFEPTRDFSVSLKGCSDRPGYGKGPHLKQSRNHRTNNKSYLARLDLKRSYVSYSTYLPV